MPRKYQASYTSRIALNLVKSKLIDSGAVRFCPEKPESLSSGLITPVKIDNHVFLANIADWRDLTELMQSRIDENCLTPDVIVGTDCSSSMQAQAVAFRMGLPAAVVHLGVTPPEKMKVEGTSVSGKRVLLVTDHIATGHTCRRAVEILREEGADVREVLTVTNFDFPETKKLFDNLCLKLIEVLPIVSVLETAYQKSAVTQTQKEEIAEWLINPTFTQNH